MRRLTVDSRYHVSDITAWLRGQRKARRRQSGGTAPSGPDEIIQAGDGEAAADMGSRHGGLAASSRPEAVQSIGLVAGVLACMRACSCTSEGPKAVLLDSRIPPGWASKGHRVGTYWARPGSPSIASTRAHCLASRAGWRGAGWHMRVHNVRRCSGVVCAICLLRSGSECFQSLFCRPRPFPTSPETG